MKDRYFSHGSFGTVGVNRVRLVRSRSSGVFLVDYRDKKTGKRHRVNLGTTDLAAAHNEILRITDELTELGYSRRTNAAIIYVVQRGDEGPIKVGISRNFKRRIEALQTGNAERLKLLRTFSLADVERAIHAELEKTGRLEGEWFSADLLPIVDRFFAVPKEILQKRKIALSSKLEKRLLAR